MPLGLLTTIPHIAPLVHLLGGLLVTSYPTRRSEREAFILHIQHVIPLLEGASSSASDTHSDINRRVLNLKMRLANILEDLAPSNRSIVRRVRARWMYNERFIHETKHEIDNALRLIELKTILSLSGGMTSLSGGMERLISIASDPAFRTAPDMLSDPGVFSPHNETCPCGVSQGNYTIEGGSNLAATTQREPSIEECPGFDEQVLDAAYQNVLHHRCLVQQDHRHRYCLVKSLNLLVQLLRRAGQVSDALKYSLEANQLLGTLQQEMSIAHNEGFGTGLPGDQLTGPGYVVR
ncbi:unnamed protein product [Rhizoctonia solani]|uniref:Uncharacterized protein n=1 Tax=Rhizoctonia solani TaxID=456999 RepID=A0A8H3ASY5_9AGAM|nr:unnamed protein product [Rhizoctonia solani]CAE6438203.1 unnamed protein product [Rhizoctonia solani]